MQRQRAADRRQLIDVLMEVQKEDAMELEKVKEGMIHSLKKIKFVKKFIEDMELMSSVDEAMDSEALMIGEIPISLVNVERKHHATEEDVGKVGVTIESSEKCKPQKVILEKPFMEMTRLIKPLCVRSHLNGRSVSKVLIDNGSTVNVMSLRMLRALGRSINDLIETKVVVSAFTGEVSKTLGILPIDITIGSKTALFAFL